jgi:hypothetical protein
MGTIYKADCPCGYESSELFEGCGRAGIDSCYELASCEHCHIIVSIRSSSIRHRCPKCSRKVQALNIDGEENDGDNLNSIILSCPLCGNLTMKLHGIGL